MNISLKNNLKSQDSDAGPVRAVCRMRKENSEIDSESC